MTQLVHFHHCVPGGASGMNRVLSGTPVFHGKQLSLLAAHMLWLAGAPGPSVKCSVCSRGQELYSKANCPPHLVHVEISVAQVSAWDRSLALGVPCIS